MTAPEIFVTAISATFACTCAVLAAIAYARTGELLTPWTLFLGMSLIDVYVPAALFFPVGLELPPWLSLLARDVAMPAVLVFTVGAGLFAWGYHRADRLVSPRAAPPGPTPVKWRVIVLATLVVGLFFFTIAASVIEAGGIASYLTGRLTNRFAVPVTTGGWLSLAVSLRGQLLPVMFVLAGVAFSRRHAWPWLGRVLPILAGIAAMTTLLRGSILALILGLAVIERARLTDEEHLGVPDASRRTLRSNHRILLICVAGALLFVGYGTARNYFTEQEYSGRATIGRAAGIELSRFVRGEGFIGLLAVVDAYPRDVPYMGGRTLVDMLLLPVPRAVWPAKPVWYGIDDITRAMGWPASMQSAVTMPGELYANFAMWGVPLMWLYGWVFGIMRGFRFDSVFRYIYAFIFVPMMFPTFWMAFTGFVNNLTPIPLLVVALWFVFPTIRTARHVTETAV